MTVPVNIFDPTTDNHWHINGEGEGSVVVHTHPPVDETVSALPFRQFFTDDGTATGSSDMLVDGSVINVDFSITAQPTVDIYIKTLSVIVADAGARLNLFGAIAELTNGVLFTHNTNESGTLVLHEGITTNLKFVRLGLNNPPIGSGTSAFRADLTGGGADAYMPVIDFKQLFGMPWGLRLRKGSNDTVKFTIRDNVSTIDQFDVVGYGIKI